MSSSTETMARRDLALPLRRKSATMLQIKANPPPSKPPVISQAEKLVHWISALLR